MSSRFVWLPDSTATLSTLKAISRTEEPEWISVVRGVLLLCITSVQHLYWLA